MRDDAARQAAWTLVVRVAMVGSLLAAAVGAALYRFVGIAPAPIVLATALIGLAVGLTLPPARPHSAALRNPRH